MSAPASQLLSALAPPVVAFRTEAFALAEELEWLGQLRAMHAPVGVVFHCTRTLEVLAREALSRSGLARPRLHGVEAPRMNDVLKQLMDYNRLHRETYRLLDRLRDLGNKARHVVRKVSTADADQGYAIVIRGLQWYFCDFPEGPRLKALTTYNQPLDSLLPHDVTTLLAMLESAGLDERGFLATLGLERQACPVLVSPVLASVLIEKLLDAGRPEAQVVLSAAVERFPDDVRLRQLQGLIWSRGGKLEEACAWLEATETTDSAADEETQGILAGAYKRRADAELARREGWLKAAHAKYERGWRQSRETNTYLGINAAALALWLRLPNRGTAIAAKIRDLLDARRRGLAEHSQALNLWDQLTLAEAHLLLEEFDSARKEYFEAGTRFPGQGKALEVARGQAKKDLEAMGRGDMIAAVLGG
jgi:hypothetical protein